MTSKELPIHPEAGTGEDGRASDQRKRLLEAVRNGHVNEIQALLGNLDTVNEKSNIKYALQEASASGHEKIVSILLGAGADLKGEPERCEIHHAMQVGRDICKNIACGRTALQAAAKGGHTEVVSTLLKAGTDIEAQCDGVTALQVAAEGGYTEIVSILLKAGARTEARFDRKTALQLAVEGGYPEIVSVLLKAGADVDAPPSEYSGRTALHAAAEDGHAEIVSILLKAGANIEAQLDGRTALQAATQGGQTEIVSMLLKAGADIEARLDGRTTLQVAAAGGHLGIIPILLKAGAKVNALPSHVNGRTALQAAAEGGHLEMVSILLKADANVNARPSEHGGKTALHAAAEGGHINIVSILLKAHAEIETKVDGKTALQAAAEGGYAEIVSILLKAGANVDVAQLEHGGRTALHVAVEGGHAETVSVLLKADANIEAQLDGRTALQIAAAAGDAVMVSILLRAGANIEATPSEYNGRTALLAAAEGGHAEVVSILLKAGANIDTARSAYSKRTALQAAAEGGHDDILPMLLRAGVNIGAPPSTWGGRTALQAAIEDGHAEIVSILLNAGAKINDVFLERQELRKAVEHENPEIVHIPGDIWPLWIAAKKEHEAVVRTLMSHGVGIAAGNPDMTAFRLAAEGGHPSVVQTLLKAGVDINARDKHGRTCLTWAISRPDMVRLLLNKGADMHLQALDGATPLHCAVRGQYKQSAVLLLKAGANTESEDYENRKPLDILLHDLKSSSEPTDFVKLLLEHGCDVGRREMSSWRTMLNAKFTDVIVIKETLSPRGGSDSVSIAGSTGSGGAVREKPSIKIELTRNPQKPPPFTLSDYFQFPVIRRLYSGSRDNILFPALNAETAKFSRQQASTDGSVIEWQWFQLLQFGASSGYGLSKVGNLVTEIDKRALLSCYICFELLQVPNTEDDQNSENLGRPFQADLQKKEISWIMRKACVQDFQPDPETLIDANSYPIFRSVDFRSTIDIGWVPDNGIDFFTLFILHIHKEWRALFEKADTHQIMNRKILLQKKGRTTNFIDNLLIDAQQWSNFRALLQTHVRKARDLVQDFEKQRHLFDQAGDRMEVQAKRGKTEEAINKLSKAIRRMELEVEGEIRKLDDKTKEMILLEFNLVSIYEARTSKITGMSMKRLSWITFIFLPLMFVASVFGMNIDLINGGPPWYWVVVLGALIFMLVISVWGLLKIFRMEEWPESGDDATIPEKFKALSANLGRGWRETVKKMRHDDLESGRKRTSAVFEFKPPPRQWTKLKDL